MAHRRVPAIREFERYRRIYARFFPKISCRLSATLLRWKYHIKMHGANGSFLFCEFQPTNMVFFVFEKGGGFSRPELLGKRDGEEGKPRRWPLFRSQSAAETDAARMSGHVRALLRPPPAVRLAERAPMDLPHAATALPSTRAPPEGWQADEDGLSAPQESKTPPQWVLFCWNNSLSLSITFSAQF